MENELVVQNKSDLVEVKTGFAALGSATNMESRIIEYEEKRSVITNYIARNFAKGYDFGPADPRNPKPTLLKPGAEKICRLFNTSPRWQMDRDTWEMLGQPKDVVCYKCEIISNETGAIIGEGRGAERVGNKQRDHNKAIKNAEKCALVDAALYTFMLSEMFTQDDAGRSGFMESKRMFAEKISEARAGVKSELTDVQFMRKVLVSELHKADIMTPRELEHINDVVFEKELYNLSTGEKTDVKK